MFENIQDIAEPIAGVFFGIYLAYKMISDRKRHEEITENQLYRNSLAVEQTSKLDSLQDSIEMLNGFKTDDRVAKLKHLAYGDQKNYWVKELASLFERNGFINKHATISNIKDVIAKTISNTDRLLAELIPCRYLASTKGKIEFINDSDVPSIIYDIFIISKTDRSKLAQQLGGVYDKALGMVKNNFYNDSGVVKDV